MSHVKWALGWGLEMTGMHFQSVMSILWCSAQHWAHYMCDINANGPPVGPVFIIGLQQRRERGNGDVAWSEGRSVEEKCRWQLGREVGGRKNKKRKIKKDIPRMQVRTQLQVLVGSEKGSVERNRQKSQAPPHSYLRTRDWGSFLLFLSHNPSLSQSYTTLWEIWKHFKNVFRAFPFFLLCHISGLLLWHNNMFTHHFNNAACTLDLFSYHSVKEKKTPPSMLTGVFVLNNIPSVPSHYLFIHRAENRTPTLVRNASSSKSREIFTVLCVFTSLRFASCQAATGSANGRPSWGLAVAETRWEVGQQLPGSNPWQTPPCSRTMTRLVWPVDLPVSWLTTQQ